MLHDVDVLGGTPYTLCDRWQGTSTAGSAGSNACGQVAGVRGSSDSGRGRKRGRWLTLRTGICYRRQLGGGASRLSMWVPFLGEQKRRANTDSPLLRSLFFYYLLVLWPITLYISSRVGYDGLALVTGH